MKNLRNSAFLLSLASLSLIGGDLFAQSGNVRLGYCTTSYSRGLVAQGQTGSHIYQAAVKFTSDLLDKYEGDKIDSVEFAIKPMRGQMASVFVCTDLDNIQGTTLASANASGYGEGWNKVALRRSVTIKKNMTLYVGYQILIGDGEDYDCLLFDESTYAVEGKNWYGLDDQWFSNTSGIDRNLCIRAVVSGDNMPDNDVTLISLEPVRGGDYVQQNAPQSFYAYVQNNGRKPVDTMTLSALSHTATGEQTAESAYEGLGIPNNEPTRILLDNVVIPVEGNFTTTFTVSRVNGADDPYPSDNSTQRNGFSIKEGTSPVARNILFEEFTSEGYEESPLADEMHRKVIAESDKRSIVWVKHHRNYGSYKDKFVIDEDADYSELYGTSRPFVPASCFDRLVISGMEDSGPAYYVPYEDYMTELFSLADGQPSFVSLDVASEADGSNLNVTVAGHAGTNEMPMQTDLRLTTWLVEDSIASTTQLGAADYVQNGVIRKVLSGGAWGDRLDISAYDFEKKYAVDIDPEWNAKNLRVVSFVSNYDSNALNRRVYNSAQAACKTSTGISSVSGGKGGGRAFSVVGGTVMANEGFRLIDVCDVAGRKVSANGLGAGLYIVRTTDGKQVYTQKISVKR